MAVTVAQVRAFDRSFDDPVRFPDQLIQTYLDQCGVWLSLPKFGTAADTAQLYWTCHQLTAQADGAAGKAGPVSAQSVGDVKVNYASTNILFKSPDYNLTTYGTNLLRLMRIYGTLGKAVA